MCVFGSRVVARHNNPENEASKVLLSCPHFCTQGSSDRRLGIRMSPWLTAPPPADDGEAWKSVVYQVPDSILLFERVRRNAERRTTRAKNRAGRPPVMKECPVCGMTLTTTEMLDHQRQTKHSDH